MKLNFPLRYIKNNMMYTCDNEIWAYYRLRSISIPPTAENKKKELKKKFQHLISELKDCGEVDIFMIPRDMTLEDRFKELEKSFSEDCFATANYYAKNTIEILQNEMGMIYTYDWIIGVPLKSQLETGSVKDGIRYSYERIRKTVMDKLNYQMDISDSDFDSCRELQELMLRKMSLFQGMSLSKSEMYYLNRLNFIRNMPHTFEQQSEHITLENMTDSIIDPSSRAGMLSLRSIEGESTVAFLPISDTPLNISRMHVAEVLQTVPFPVELRYKVKFQELKGSFGVEGKAKRSALRLKNVVKESRSIGNNESDEVAKSRVVVEDLKRQVDADKEIVNWLGCIAIYARNEKECRQRINAVVSVFKARGIELSKAQFQQVYLYYKNLLGVGLEATDTKWIQTTSVEGFCENLLAVNQRVGFRSGWYIGRVDPHLSSAKSLRSAIYSSRNIILSNPFTANKWNEEMGTASPHIAVTGETGMGKTFLVSLLFTFISMLDVKGLFVDPKTEKIKQYQKFLSNAANKQKYPYYYDLVSKFHLVTFDPENSDNWGVLDPITFLKGADAKDTAEAMIHQIINIEDTRLGQSEVSKAIREIVERRTEGEDVGMLHVIDRLKMHKEKEVSEIGNLLDEKIKGSVLRLGFSDGKSAGLSFEKRITIIGVLGLSIPKENDNPDYYSQSERKSLALMIPLGKFCEKFGSMNDEQETFEVFEEAWIFNTSSVGKKILNSIKRVGRSQNNMLIYSTQSVTDVTSEDDHGNFGTIFAFNEPKEEDKILKHVGVDVIEQNREWLSGMKKGQCLMLDPYKDVQKISVHCLFPEIKATFDTVKETSGSKAETMFV
ncbi:ATP-binding protein [Enterococcus sp. CWB-B31]|uniref:ATP-binding protein n=1 Tax=Enterococcus sp. CWB-B31 TaxID=2885159 RepID=UPI001E5E893E|nr:ATP-binding protein [Enterococcus sp. CWB-B31]MCB5956415.1 ATP-binding protein [Enterococcus sp. CWB-B31]